MKNRLVAIVLTVILVLNNGAALAHPTHSSAVPEVHTVRFGVMEGDEQLLPLERQGTSLVGQGGDFVNAQGEVNTRIEGVYYQDSTLVSASRGDTSFSLSPLMLEEYFLATPEPTPTPTPTPSQTPSMTPTPLAYAHCIRDAIADAGIDSHAVRLACSIRRAGTIRYGIRNTVNPVSYAGGSFYALRKS